MLHDWIRCSSFQYLKQSKDVPHNEGIINRVSYFTHNLINCWQTIFQVCAYSGCTVAPWHCPYNYCRIDMVLGDFNLNYLNATHSQPLISLLESLNYTQIVTEPTFVFAGSLFDHVYVRPTSIQIISSPVLSVYYSDHDAVVTSLQFLSNC